MYTAAQRKLGRVSHLIYDRDLETPGAVAVVRHGLTGTQTEVVAVDRIDLINPKTQIVQLRGDD